jgi:phage terminase large subunit-like protein
MVQGADSRYQVRRVLDSRVLIVISHRFAPTHRSRDRHVNQGESVRQNWQSARLLTATAAAEDRTTAVVREKFQKLHYKVQVAGVCYGDIEGYRKGIARGASAFVISAISRRGLQTKKIMLA